ncbi:MAG: helix-turn-helix domain-containing protein [Pseudolysinimonas sp.]
MTMLAQAQLDDLAAAPRELEIIVDTESGSADWRVAFAVQEQPAVRRPQAMTSLRIHVPLEVIPASASDLRLLVHASAVDALPDSVLAAVTAQVTADLSVSAAKTGLFAREPRWAAVVVRAVEELTGHRAAVSLVDRARRAQISRIIRQYSDDPRLTPETMADAMGISRRTLYLAAEPLGGLAEYLRSVRAARAIERIEDPTESASLEVIARESGFTSPRRMTRAIQSELGVNPTSLRLRARKGAR